MKLNALLKHLEARLWVCSLKRYPSECPGVYMLWCWQAGVGQLLYIGKAGNIYARVAYNHRPAGKIPFTVTRWVRVRTPALRDLLETRSIRKYRPPYNRRKLS
jgi:excinuclease UvrABC nuclease subunit